MCRRTDLQGELMCRRPHCPMKLICRRVDECENWCAIIADEQESWWVVEPISMRADVQELLMSWCARIADEHESWCARMADELRSSHASELMSWKADIHYPWELMRMRADVQEWLMIRRADVHCARMADDQEISTFKMRVEFLACPPPPPRGMMTGHISLSFSWNIL